MADSKRYEDYGKPTLQQGGWARIGDDNDYIDYLPADSTTYYYRICTLDYVPQHHPNQITITGIASKELEVSVLPLRSDNYIISSLGWRDNGYTFNLGSTYDKIGVMFRFKNGDTITPNDVTFDEVGTWQHSLRKLTTATESVENPLYSDGTAITAYTIKGNTVQTGTPTPSNPVDVNGVGVRTENLFNATWESGSLGKTGGTFNDTNAIRTVGFIACEAEKLYSFSPELDVTETWVNYYDNNNGGLSRYRITDGTFTTPQGCTRLRFRLSKTDIGVSPVPQPLSMLNVGTPLPYEPYGYKIPISSDGVTTNIYLGSTQTVRQIKKVVLDGTENWQGSDTSPTKNLTLEGYAKISGISCVSTHYNPANNVVSGDPIPYDSCCFYIGASNVVYLKGNESDTYPKTITDFKAYLAQQYANGTPVTIWYVLETSETATVNEPLMKIGDYADTVSNATAIPTTEGANSITVDTTVQPSEFAASWTGWHDSSVKEWDGSDWQ